MHLKYNMLLGATSVAQLAVLVVSGHRPELKLVPQDAPDYITDLVQPLMVDCWDKDPRKRPTFKGDYHNNIHFKINY